MNKILNIINYCDSPQPWGLYFQDSASPQMEALVELHDNIMFYLVIILFAVAWILLSIIRNYVGSNYIISNKYLNHGKIVPNLKYSNIKNYKSKIKLNSKKFYSTKSSNTINKLNYLSLVNPTKTYNNMFLMKKTILTENKNKSGIYLLTNLITGDIYVGQSIDLSRRLGRYYTLSYLRDKGSFIITKALVKYGYTNFSVSILEYCDRKTLLEREQHYLNILTPVALAYIIY